MPVGGRRGLSMRPLPVAPTMTHAEVRIYGPRNAPAGLGKLKPEDFQDFEVLLASFRERFPTFTTEQFIRYIWVKGLIAARWAVVDKSIPAPR